MEQFKRAQVIMLPTKEQQGDFSQERQYPCIVKHSWMFDTDGRGQLAFVSSNIRTPTQLQHLYITSSDLIKEGDWISFQGIVTQALKGEEFSGKEKIIITTDPLLNLPRPTDNFLQLYAEYYNKNKTITDVLVESFSNFESINKGQDGFPEDDISWWVEKVKVKSDNTVEIRIVEEADVHQKKAKVTMLPTKMVLAPNIGIKHANCKAIRVNDTLVGLTQENLTTIVQHLYFTTDEPIIDGDLFLNDEGVWRCKDGVIPTVLNPRKIIATTDVELGHGDNVGLWKSLPQPSIPFVQKFIEAVNKNQVITDVLIEYRNQKYSERFDNGLGEGQTWGYRLQPNVNPKDNTITIKKLKDVWFKEEIELSIMYCLSEFAAERGLTPTAELMKIVNDWGKKWCEENL